MAKKLPSVVIVGRPNVGKSTLFNRLTGTRRSIVTDEPGITRDRIYGTAEWNGRTFEVVDTGGIVPGEQAFIPREIFRQAHVAIERAAHLVLVVDGRAGVTPLDADLARLLRRTGKPLAIAVNKADTPALESLAAPFYTLGDAVFPVSAEHSLGVDALLDAITEEFPAQEPAETAHEGELEGEEETASKSGVTDEPIRVAIIGRPNVGKSTLLNRLAGVERAIVSPIPGTTRDAVDTLVRRAGREYTFVDTAGIRRKGKTELVAEKLSVIMARKHLEQADVALMVMDAAQGVTSSDATIASYAQESGRSVILVMNKWDLALDAARTAVRAAMRNAGDPPASLRGRGELQLAIPTDRGVGADSRAHSRAGKKSATSRKATYRQDKLPSQEAILNDPGLLLAEYERIVRAKLKFLDYAPIVFLSAHTGSRTEKLFPLIDQVAAARRRRVSTGEMNRWLERVDLDRGTTPFGKRMKIYYMTQAGTAPPSFVLFTNQPRPLHFSYARFLENQLRAHFDFTGTPIHFITRLKKR